MKAGAAEVVNVGGYDTPCARQHGRESVVTAPSSAPTQVRLANSKTAFCKATAGSEPPLTQEAVNVFGSVRRRS